MPHDLNDEWMHVYDWLDLPPADEGERGAKEWLGKFTVPASQKGAAYYAYLDSRNLFCDYEGERYRVCGASRLGDIWLTSDLTTPPHRAAGVPHYEKRVDIAGCSNWELLVVEEPAEAA